MIRVEVHTLCHQEAKLVPYVMRHYKGWAEVFAYTGHSTDGTEKLLGQLGANVLNLNTNNEANDYIFKTIQHLPTKRNQRDEF